MCQFQRDSVTVNNVTDTMTFYPRYDEAVDVVEIRQGIEQIGFTAKSMTVHVEGAK